jgi:GMC oxidoreductase
LARSPDRYVVDLPASDYRSLIGWLPSLGFTERGVVSPRGEVHGYPGLFVADGSVIPTSIGFHLVMIISAVSEHIAEAVVESF